MTAKDIDLMENYQCLANAIIETAARDYVAAKKKLVRGNDGPLTTATVNQCTRFFRSQYFEALTDVDGESLIRALDERVDYELAHTKKRHSNRAGKERTGTCV